MRTPTLLHLGDAGNTVWDIREQTLTGLHSPPLLSVPAASWASGAASPFFSMGISQKPSSTGKEESRLWVPSALLNNPKVRAKEWEAFPSTFAPI